MALAWPVYRLAVLLMMSNVLFQCVVQSFSNSLPLGGGLISFSLGSRAGLDLGDPEVAGSESIEA